MFTVYFTHIEDRNGRAEPFAQAILPAPPAYGSTIQLHHTHQISDKPEVLILKVHDLIFQVQDGKLHETQTVFCFCETLEKHTEIA